MDHVEGEIQAPYATPDNGPRNVLPGGLAPALDHDGGPLHDPPGTLMVLEPMMAISDTIFQGTSTWLRAMAAINDMIGQEDLTSRRP